MTLTATAVAGAIDEQRDEVALRLAERMIEAGKPVFGISRGLQELNVLFEGTSTAGACAQGYRGGAWEDGYDRLLDHRHDVTLTENGVIARLAGTRRLTVASVHEQGVDRLGAGLTVEAVAVHDDLVEAIAGRACGADVLAVQWQPEGDVQRSAASRAFFAHIGRSLNASRDASAELAARSRTAIRSPASQLVGH